jgi:hypothetical protein
MVVMLFGVIMVASASVEPGQDLQLLESALKGFFLEFGDCTQVGVPEMSVDVGEEEREMYADFRTPMHGRSEWGDEGGGGGVKQTPPQTQASDSPPAHPSRSNFVSKVATISLNPEATALQPAAIVRLLPCVVRALFHWCLRDPMLSFGGVLPLFHWLRMILCSRSVVRRCVRWRAAAFGGVPRAAITTSDTYTQ